MIKLSKPKKPIAPKGKPNKTIQKINISNNFSFRDSVSLDDFQEKINKILTEYKKYYYQYDLKVETYGSSIYLSVIEKKSQEEIEEENIVKKEYMQKLKEYNYALAEYYKQKAREINEQ